MPASKVEYAEFYRRMKSFLSILSLAIGVCIALITIVTTISCWQPIPIGDQWDELISGRDITWQWLISPHNEHRIFFPRLIFIADRWLSGESNIVSFTANIIFQLGVAFLLFRLALGAGIKDKYEKIWVAGFILTLLFWLGQYENFIWGFQVQYFAVVLTAIGSFATLALGKPQVSTLALTVILEIIAVYTLSSGMVVPFLNIALAIWLRQPRAAVVLLAFAACVLLGSYLVGYSLPPLYLSPPGAPQHLGDIIIYMFAEIGGPIANLMEAILGNYKIIIAVLMGAIGMALFGYVGWINFRIRRKDQSCQAALFAIASFVVAMTFLTAIGRIRFGFDQALSSRYATPVMVFWVSIVLLLLVRSGHGVNIKNIGVILILPMQLLIAVSEPHFVKVAHHLTFAKALAIPALLTNVADVELLKKIHPDPLVPLTHSKSLRLTHTSIFRDSWADWLGTPLSDHVILTGSSYCQGGLYDIKQVAVDPLPGWRITGWVTSVFPGKNIQRVILTNGEGQVAGYALANLDLALLHSVSFSEEEKNHGWVGEFLGLPSESITAFALLNDNKEACRLGSPFKPGEF